MSPEEKLEILGAIARRRGAVRPGNSTIPKKPDIRVFGEHSRGIDVLGAAGGSLLSRLSSALKPAAPRAGFVARTAAGGGRFTSLVPLSAKKGDHATTLKNAKDVGNRAISVGNKLLAAINKAPKVSAKVAVAVAAKKTAVRGGVSNDYNNGYNDGCGNRPAASSSADYAAGYKEGLACAALAAQGIYGDVIRGAAAKALIHPVSRKPRMSVAQMKKIATQAQKSGKDLLAYAAKYGKLVQASNAKDTAKQGAVASKLGLAARLATRASAAGGSTPAAHPAVHAAATGKTKLRGDAYEAAADVLGDVIDVLGAALPNPSNPAFLMDGTPNPAYLPAGSAAPDPYNPGYLTNGMPDPAYYGAGSGAPPDPYNPGYLTDGSLDPAYGSTGATMPGPPDYGLGPAPISAPPLVAGQDYAPDPYAGHPWDDPQAYTSLPAGAILYDNQPTLDSTGEQATIGSANRFSKDSGVSMSNSAIQGNARGGQDSGFQYSRDGWQHYDHASSGSGYSRPTDSEMNDLNGASMREGYGPIIGRPGTPFQGLRFLSGSGALNNQKTLFWYYDTAADHAKAPGDLLRLNQAIADYKTAVTAAATDAAAQAAQEQLDQQQAQALAKQQALEDAANQRQMDQDTAAQQAMASQQDIVDQQAQRTQDAADQSAAAIQAAQADAQAQRDADQQQRDEDRAVRLADKQAELDQKRADAEQARDERELDNALSLDERAAALQQQQGGSPPDRGTGDAQADDGGQYAEDGQQDDGQQYDDAATPSDGGWSADQLMDAPDEMLGALTPAQYKRLQKKIQKMLGKITFDGSLSPGELSMSFDPSRSTGGSVSDGSSVLDPYAPGASTYLGPVSPSKPYSKDMDDDSVLGALSPAAQKKLKKILAKIAKAADVSNIHGDGWEQGEGDAEARERGEDDVLGALTAAQKARIKKMVEQIVKPIKTGFNGEGPINPYPNDPRVPIDPYPKKPIEDEPDFVQHLVHKLSSLSSTAKKSLIRKIRNSSNF